MRMVDQKRVEYWFFLTIETLARSLYSLTSHNGDRCKQNTVRTIAKALTNKHKLYKQFSISNDSLLSSFCQKKDAHAIRRTWTKFSPVIINCIEQNIKLKIILLGEINVQFN